ncbi:MAG: hypothetical protein WC445_01375 [Patescibacteria group bacterium]
MNELEKGSMPIKEFGRDEIRAGDLVMFDGKIYRAVSRDSGYTIRQYYSHSTPEKGPGPGWDYKAEVLEKYGANEPSQLPDDPYHIIEFEPADVEK